MVRHTWIYRMLELNKSQMLYALILFTQVRKLRLSFSKMKQLVTEVEIKHKFLDFQSISVKALPPRHAYPALKNRKGLVYQTLSKSSEKSIFSSFFGYNLREKYIAISHTSEDMCKSLFKSQVKNYIDYILKMRIFLHILSNNSFLFFQSFLRFIVYFLSLFQYLPKFLPRKISKRRGKLLLTCIFVI